MRTNVRPRRGGGQRIRPRHRLLLSVWDRVGTPVDTTLCERHRERGKEDTRCPRPNPSSPRRPSSAARPVPTRLADRSLARCRHLRVRRGEDAEHLAVSHASSRSHGVPRPGRDGHRVVGRSVGHDGRQRGRRGWTSRRPHRCVELRRRVLRTTGDDPAGSLGPERHCEPTAGLASEQVREFSRTGHVVSLLCVATGGHPRVTIM